MKKTVIYSAAMSLVIFIFHLMTPNKAAMTAISEAALAVKRLICRLCSLFPFSVAEIMLIAAFIAAVVFVFSSIAAVAKAKRRLHALLRRAAVAAAVLLTLYFLLCIFLNASYYAEGFADKIGIRPAPSGLDELYATAKLFADKLAQAGGRVSRGETGLFDATLDSLLDESESFYRGVDKLFPFLAIKDVRHKPLLFSRLMSRLNYTGFYFPFTGEANINADIPSCMIPVTAAHEMAHQRGVASEQEANFVAILACTESGLPDYEYSGWLLGYLNLSGALQRRDEVSCRELWDALPENVRKDIRANNEYWAKYETRAAEVTEKIYDSFLKSNGQELGVESYGAVVDLLIAWHKEGGFD
jgi:hypothetical protein